MTDRIRWGILSTANIGLKRVIPAIQASHNGDVMAIASRDFARANDIASDLDIPLAFGSYEDLFNAPNVDAIYNPLPNALHAGWSIKAAEAGKPVLCEKPLAVDAPEAQRMVDAFAEQNLLFAEAFMYRFHPQTQKVLAMVRDGAVGTVTSLSAAFTFPVRNKHNIRLQADLAGGALMDVGCYCVNVMRLLTGEEPDEAHAVAHFGPETRVDESIAGALRFPSGVVGHFEASLRAYRSHQVEIRGTKGRILVPEAFVPDINADTTVHHWYDDWQEDKIIDGDDHYKLMVEDFADALLKGRPPRYAPEDAVAQMRVMDRLLASARGE